MKHIALLLALGFVTTAFVGCDSTRITRHYEENTTTIENADECCGKCSGHDHGKRKKQPRGTVTTEQTSSGPEIVVE